MNNKIECTDKYDYINNDTLEQYKDDYLEKMYSFHPEAFKLTLNQYKHYLKFVEDHKDCRINKDTGYSKFGTIGGGTSIIFKTTKKDVWYIFDEYIKCEGCDIEEKLEDMDIKLDISEDQLMKDYEAYCKHGPSFNKIEYYRFNEIWEEYVEEKGEQLEVTFMGTGLGYLINVKTKNFIYSITDTSNW